MTDKEICTDFVYGHGLCNLKLICANFTFSVHCDVFSQSSVVWDKILNGAFAESLEETVTLLGDDPRALKLTLDIVYGLLCGEIDATSFEIDGKDRAALDTLAEKYELNVVSKFLSSVTLCRAQQDQLKSFQQQQLLQLHMGSEYADHSGVSEV